MRSNESSGPRGCNQETLAEAGVLGARLSRAPQGLAAEISGARSHGLSAKRQSYYSTRTFAAERRWLIYVAALFFVASMHKFATRDALATGTGLQGIIETAGNLGALFCALWATWGLKREHSLSPATICFFTLGILALASSWRSYYPPLSVTKAVIFLAVLGTGYLVCQAGMGKQYLRAIYWCYVVSLVVGLIVAFLFPRTYPLFSIDGYSGRTTMSVFSTFFGAVGEETALLLLLAPLLFEKTAWVSGLFLFAMNVLAGSKTSTGLLCFLLGLRFLHGIKRWRSWQSVTLILGSVCIMIFAVLSSLHSEDLLGSVFKPTEAIYGSQVNNEAKDANGRGELWKGAIALLPNVLVLGYGFDGSREQMVHIASWSGSTHDGYLELALASGIIGVSVFLIGLLSILRSSLQASPRIRFYLLSLLAFILIDSIISINFVFPSFFGTLLLLWLSYAIMKRHTELSWRTPSIAS